MIPVITFFVYYGEKSLAYLRGHVIYKEESEHGK
jgi:hypothetical protein